VEEFAPLRPGETVRLDDGSTADLWTEALQLQGAEAIASYVDGRLPGVPAVTRHQHERGTAWYVATRLDRPAVASVTDRLLAEAGVEPVAPTRAGVEVTRRVAEDGRSWVFVVNHTDQQASCELTGHDLVADQTVTGLLQLDPGGVAVVRQSS
jgi:beta-galactosidase